MNCDVRDVKIVIGHLLFEVIESQERGFHPIMRSNRILYLLVFVLLVAERKAFAYTDPGSGAMLWQLLLASVLSAAFTVRYFFQRIKSRFSRTTGQSTNVRKSAADRDNTETRRSE